MSTDREMFESALSDAPIEEVVTAPVEAAPSETGENGQPRDQSGRFAPKAADVPAAPVTPAAEAPAAPAPKPEDTNSGAIPAWRLAEVTQERNALRDRIAEMEAKLRQPAPQAAPAPVAPTVPDMFSDPEGYTAYMEQKFEAKLRMQRAEDLMEAAAEKYGEKFTEAYNAMVKAKSEGDHHSVARVANAKNPGEELIKWHKQRSLIDTTGGDLDAFLAQERAKWEAERAGQQQPAPQQQQPGNIVQLPPSLSRIGAASGPTPGGDMSSESLFRSALS